MKDFIRQYFTTIEWTLGAVVTIMPIVAWAITHPFNGSITLYDIFPPLGLVAFGLMWTHFIMGALRRYSGVIPSKRRPYLTLSMGMVLALIILHPGLLIVALYMDGLGLPPDSYLTVYSTQVVAVGLGSLSLMIFLAFELKRWFGAKNWWRYVEMAQVVGMAAVFVHALQLGDELNIGWFAALWWVYGITLTAAIIYTYYVNRLEKVHAR